MVYIVLVNYYNFFFGYCWLFGFGVFLLWFGDDYFCFFGCRV